jgi:hypothetical protein
MTACSGGIDRAPANPTGSQQVESQPAEPQQAVETSVRLTASQTSVTSGDSATLTWSSEGAESCSASGGWSGSKTVSGSEVTEPITANTTYSLTCSGSEGNAVAMIQVTADGLLSISWQPPTENVDGSPLTDLSGFTIYYGEDSGDYTNQVEINNPSATNYSVTLASGEYYVAMTALDLEGNESALSNEVVKATL